MLKRGRKINDVETLSQGMNKIRLALRKLEKKI